MNYYSKIDYVAAQIGNVSHMQAQFTQSDTIAGMISKSNTFMQCYGEIRSGGVMTSATNTPARSVMKRRVIAKLGNEGKDLRTLLVNMAISYPLPSCDL